LLTKKPNLQISEQNWEAPHADMLYNGESRDRHKITPQTA